MDQVKGQGVKERKIVVWGLRLDQGHVLLQALGMEGRIVKGHPLKMKNVVNHVLLMVVGASGVIGVSVQESVGVGVRSEPENVTIHLLDQKVMIAKGTGFKNKLVVHLVQLNLMRT